MQIVDKLSKAAKECKTWLQVASFFVFAKQEIVRNSMTSWSGTSGTKGGCKCRSARIANHSNERTLNQNKSMTKKKRTGLGIGIGI